MNMSKIKKFIKEGLEPIDNAISRVSGISIVDRPEKQVVTAFLTDRTTVNMDEVHLNTDSKPYVEGQKTQLTVNLQMTGVASINVTRTPATQNSPAQTDAITMNQ